MGEGRLIRGCRDLDLRTEVVMSLHMTAGERMTIEISVYLYK